MRRVLAIAGSAVFLVLAPGTVAGLVPWWISRWRLETPMNGWLPLRFVGCLLIAAGVPILVDSFARFALQGFGTPAPVFPTRHLVITGLYRFVRNPMYVAVVSVIIGQGLLLGNIRVLEYGAVVWLGFHLFVIGYEEPTRQIWPGIRTLLRSGPQVGATVESMDWAAGEGSAQYGHLVSRPGNN
jgi:protein-S-isoprenylcysteine O-methyltransferase Ste14